MRIIEGDAMLPADERKAFAEFEKEGLEVVAEESFQIRLGEGVRLWNFEEFKDKWIAEQIAGLGDDLALRGELEDGILLFPGGKTEKKTRFLLTLQLANGPFFSDGLLFVKAALQRVVDLQQFN